MLVRQALLIVSLVAMITPSLSAQAAGLTYRWVDAEGNLQLSDTLPPHAAEQGYKVLNPSTGQVIREVLPRKTVEQQRAREEAERQAAQQRRHAAEKQAEQDRILMSLYGSEADIERARDERLERMDGRIRQTEGSIERMEANIADGHRDKSYENDLRELRRSLEQLREERREIVKRYESDLQRFRKMKRDD